MRKMITTVLTLIMAFIFAHSVEAKNKSLCPIFVLAHAQQINLSQKQEKDLEKIKKHMIKDSASLDKKIARKQDKLNNLLKEGKKTDTKKIDALEGDIKELKQDRADVDANAEEEVKQILTARQLKKSKVLAFQSQIGKK